MSTLICSQYYYQMHLPSVKFYVITLITTNLVSASTHDHFSTYNSIQLFFLNEICTNICCIMTRY
jgi:hypothetical protein